MVWLTTSTKYSSGKGILKLKGEHMMTDSDDDDATYIHVKHIKPGGKGTVIERKEQESPSQGTNTSIREGKCPGKEKCICVSLLLVSMCINITLGLYLACTTTWNTSNSGTSTSLTGDYSACVFVDCVSLGLTADGERISTSGSIHVIRIDYSEMCCLNNSEHLQKLITVFSAQYALSETPAPSENSGSSPWDRYQHGAHLFLDSAELKDDKFVWTDEYGWGSAYVGNGVDMVNGSTSIKLKQDGRYFVYSFLTFKSRETVSESYNVEHTVSRYDPDLPDSNRNVLLTGKKTLPKTSEKFTTSYLGASLVLRAGDELSVKVNKVSALYEYAPANFFGLFRLSN